MVFKVLSHIFCSSAYVEVIPWKRSKYHKSSTKSHKHENMKIYHVTDATMVRSLRENLCDIYFFICKVFQARNTFTISIIQLTLFVNMVYNTITIRFNSSN